MFHFKKLLIGLLKISAVVTLLALIALSLIYFLLPDYQLNQPDTAKVRIVQSQNGFQLYKDGKPFYIHGAAGDGSLVRLKELGGNSIRLYRYYDIDSLLYVADSLGLSVMVDLDIPPMRMGFDYKDETKVDSLVEEVKEAIIKWKDHPSVLIWNIGNELNLFYGKEFEVWRVINRIADMIHEVDPDHPTSTAIPMVWEDMILARWFCPELDILNINSFRFTLKPESVFWTRFYGWQGPYLYGEMGPMGTWQAESNPWNVPMEWGDIRKTAHLAYIYDHWVLPDPKCLGAYAFFWGQKQERTHTWYSLFSEDGEKTPLVDELSRIWTGNYPTDKSPKVKSVILNEKEEWEVIHLGAGQEYSAQALLDKGARDSVEVEWVIFKEGEYRAKFGGDKEWRPQTFPELIVSRNNNSLTFKAPEEPGDYRLFVYAKDGQNNRSSMNVPFFVVLEGF